MSLTTLCNPNKTAHYSPITFGAVCAAPNAANLDAYMSVLYNEIIDDIYPVGSHYYSTTTDNPNTLFGRGTWELVEAGRTLIGAGTNWIDLSKWKTKTTQDGAKWARILRQNIYLDGLFTSSNVLDNDDPNAWSKLGQIANFYGEDGYLEFILEYTGRSDGTQAARWKQNGNPILCTRSNNQNGYAMEYVWTDPNDSTNADIETGLYMPSAWSDGGFRNLGLAVSSANALLSGRTTGWWFAVGSYANYTHDGSTGIPGITDQWVDGNGVSLWVRYDNAVGYNFINGSTGGSSTVAITGAGWLPSHRHGMTKAVKSKGTDYADVGRGSTISDKYTTYTGGNAAHNNMQPYTKIYIWKRVE